MERVAGRGEEEERERTRDFCYICSQSLKLLSHSNKRDQKEELCIMPFPP